MSTRSVGQQSTTERGEQGSDDHEAESSGHGHGESNLGNPVKEATVRMVSDDEGYHFIAHLVHVEVGGTVRWTNDVGMHDTVAYHPDNGRSLRMPADATPWASDLLHMMEPNSYEHTFDVAGVYDYFCTPHEQYGMVGRVVVGDPDLHDQPAMADPGDDLPSEARTVVEEFNHQVNDTLHTH
ncbi:plastocyanin/azurin family copper-binding protein [Halobacteriaceae archaeon GCM10025711]